MDPVGFTQGFGYISFWNRLFGASTPQTRLGPHLSELFRAAVKEPSSTYHNEDYDIYQRVGINRYIYIYTHI